MSVIERKTRHQRTFERDSGGSKPYSLVATNSCGTSIDLINCLTNNINTCRLLGVADSSYKCQLCSYPKVSLNLGFKNPTAEDSSLKSATPMFLFFQINWLIVH
jgi:hypothetical protein